jgi:hypothetical protein
MNRATGEGESGGTSLGSSGQWKTSLWWATSSILIYNIALNNCNAFRLNLTTQGREVDDADYYSGVGEIFRTASVV